VLVRDVIENRCFVCYNSTHKMTTEPQLEQIEYVAEVYGGGNKRRGPAVRMLGAAARTTLIKTDRYCKEKIREYDTSYSSF
jgi:hypothetical protein